MPSDDHAQCRSCLVTTLITSKSAEFAKPPFPTPLRYPFSHVSRSAAVVAVGGKLLETPFLSTSPFGSCKALATTTIVSSVVLNRSNGVSRLSKRAFAERFGKHTILTVFLLTVTYASASPSPRKPDTPAMVQWKASPPPFKSF